MGVSVVKVGFS